MNFIMFLSTKTLTPSKSFQDALIAIMAENPESPKKFDEIEWDEYESTKEPTSFLFKNRRTSVGKIFKNDCIR